MRQIDRMASAIAKRVRDQESRRRVGGELARLGDVLRDGHLGGWSDVPLTIVASTGRVGSKTLTALWDLVPEVRAEHEPLPRLVHVSGRAWQEPDDGRWSDVFHAARDDLIADAHRRGLRYAETNNRLTSLAPAVLSSYRSSNAVMLWRSPDAFVTSAVRRGYYAGHHWDFARYRPRPDDPAADEWDRWSSGLRSAWLWAATNAFILDLVTAEPDRWTVVSSEDLFSGDERALRQAFGAVGASLPPRRSIDRVLTSRINAQRDGLVDVPRHRAEESERYAALVDPILTRLTAR